MTDSALRVEIDLDLVEAQLGDKWLDHLTAAAVLGNRGDGELILTPLQLFERGHLLEAGLAPGRPKVDQDQLALEIRESYPFALEVGEGNLGRWLRRRGRDKLAGLECVLLGRAGGCKRE